MKPSDYTVVYASDDRGVTQLGAAIYSLLANASNATTYKVYLLSIGRFGAYVELLNGLEISKHWRHSITFIDVSDLAATCRLTVKESWPVTAWTRVFIPNLLPEDERLVVYCDIDTLVCSDLKKAFETPLQGKATGVDFKHVSLKGSHFNVGLGMPQDCPGYFNSSVMLLDLDVFRKQDLTRKILQYVGEYSDILACPDQDALNGALCHGLRPMHSRWSWHGELTRLSPKRSKSPMNRGATREDSVGPALRPGIRHYQGPNKPWRYNHRIERRRCEHAIIESGFGEYPLPVKTFIKQTKYFAHVPIYWMTQKKKSGDSTCII